MAKLTAATVLAVLRKRAEGATYKKLAEFAGVSMSTIQQICERKIWKSLKG